MGKKAMPQYKFGPARQGEQIVYGAERPGYSGTSVGQAEIQKWITFMKQNRIRRVCCLLSDSQLAYYCTDLLSEYRQAFGPNNVCHAEIEDYHLCDKQTLATKILPFLAESDSDKTQVVVHCSGGSGRTGHVLAAWLVRHRGLSAEAALSAVQSTGRNPREAVACGNVTDEDLHAFLVGQ
jgi:protein-tyrosine phosphatase